MAKKNINVGSYMRRTKSGKMVKVDAYNQNRDILGDLLKGDPSRPTNNAKAGQFAGGSPVPVSKNMQAAQKRVADATAKAAGTSVPKKPAAKKGSPKTPDAPDAPDVKGGAKKPAKTPAGKKPTPKSETVEKAKVADSQTTQPSVAQQPSTTAPVRRQPDLLRGIPRGQYKRDTMSETERTQRVAQINERADAVLSKGDTQKRHSVAVREGSGPISRAYSPERAKIHKGIIDEMVEDARQRGVPRDGKAYVTGGLPGAGKSYVMQNRLGINLDDFVTINPDDFMEKLAARTVVPGTEDGNFSPLEMATVIHEESSDISKMAREVFESNGYNVILDVTLGGFGDGAKSKHAKTVAGLKARGYTVSGVFVDIPHPMSAESAKNRYLGGWARWMNGEEEMGGRYVPEGVAAKDVSTQGFNSSNRDNFEHVKGEFADYKIIDNSVRDDSAPLNVLDEGGNGHTVTVDDPFVTNAYDPFDDPVARLEALLAKLRAGRKTEK